MKSGISRRSFMSAGAAAAAASAAPESHASMTREKTGDLIHVGLILGEWPHSNDWAGIMNGIDGDRTFPKRTGMIMTHVWHIERDTAREFARRFDIGTVVSSFDDMIGKVDAVIIDAVFQSPWTYKLARPYLENGIPVYIDRPGADSIRKLDGMIGLAQKHDTAFWMGSSLEFMFATFEAAKLNPPETVNGYETWSGGSKGYFYTHGPHGLWWAHKTAGGGIEAVSHSIPEGDPGMGVATIRYKDRGNGPFEGTINFRSREGCLIHSMFAGHADVFRCDRGVEWQTHVYLPLMLKMQDVFFHGEEGLPESYDSLREKHRLYMAAWRSRLCENGGFVDPGALDEDWALGVPWEHPHVSPKSIYDAYTKLFGREDGEMKPPS